MQLSLLFVFCVSFIWVLVINDFNGVSYFFDLQRLECHNLGGLLVSRGCLGFTSLPFFFLGEIGS